MERTGSVLTVSPAPCRLVGGAFAVVVQALLCVVAIVALFFKWVRETAHEHTRSRRSRARRERGRERTGDASEGDRFSGAYERAERPRGRSFREWSFDVSKQGFSAIVSHAFNIFLAVVLAHTKIKYHAGPAVHPDQCAWYLINYIADCFFGVLLIFLLLRAVEATARRLGSRALAESGNYYVHGGGEPSTRVWALQCAVFVLITLISKCMLALVLIPLAKPLGQFGLFFAQPLREHPEIELVVVMVLFPAFLNVFAFWMIDSFLQKRSDHAGDGGKLEEQDLLGDGGHGGGGGRRRAGEGGEADREQFFGREIGGGGGGGVFGASASSNNITSMFQDSLCFAGDPVQRMETPSPARSVASANWDASPTLEDNDGHVNGLLGGDVEALGSINNQSGGSHSGARSSPLAAHRASDTL